MATTNRPNNPCTFDRCGGTYFYDRGNKWECANCSREYPKRLTHRRTNGAIGFSNWRTLREEWRVTDDRLQELVAAGVIKSGAIFVHSHTFNWHMDILLERAGKKLSRFELKYHTEKAKADLAAAKNFIEANTPKDFKFNA